ncbi:hypothetical protein Poli38472_003690 [Pythium oligandrum]|uniref:Prolyl 4-hydroxylase alpha subunit Fe(2+) 2OG dioxygenase domain-containing protein n=1 Tax=Pythium oligandrum TaxID=41045 RepID=A0A8K1FJC4_PYTOL|nr:hypothetical protein Poli38472_003690 [Pythium oligandrum]|eukprot:TMW65925.1 hypothetical protein Poli38472_003690 [Pythium oligandrum]
MLSKEERRAPARAVTEALAKVQSPGDYYTKGANDEYPDPGLNIQGLGFVPVPLTVESAKAIINKSHLAPYGHGEETIVNTQVRDTWELNAQTQFTLQNPAWQHFIDRITAACARDLGIDPTTHNVTAKPYKLLIYETGGKFEKHQDSEKEHGMFGTLVVVLPSVFTGGELVIHGPAGRQTESFTWDPSVGSMFSVQYAAFYGDCEHDVKAVTSGYRVCLTYNLLSTKAGTLVAPTNEAYLGLRAALDEFFAKAEARNSEKRLVYMLEHKYTKQGLGFDFLKNRDIVVMRSLAKYCEESSDGAYMLFLARVEWKEVEEEFTLDLNLPFIPYGSTLTEIASQNTIHDADGDSCYAIEAEVVPSGWWKKIDWDGDRHVPYTGNEGDYEENWYESAALIVRPTEEALEGIKTTQGVNAAVNVWLRMAKSGHPQARACAKMIFVDEDETCWTTGSDEFAETMKIVVFQWKAFDIFSLTIELCNKCTYQPLLASVMDHFGWEERIEDMIKLIEGKGSSRDAVALVCSLLAPSTPPSCVEKLLQVSRLSPPSDGHGLPSVADLACLFTKSYPETRRIIREWVDAGEKELLMKLVVPAFIEFASSIPSDQVTDELHGQKNVILEKVDASGKKMIKTLRDLWGGEETTDQDQKRQKMTDEA